MKIVSPLPHKRGRLEIIPLIDIMFFLLAAFMMVSIGKIHLKSLKVSLPTDVPAAQKETKEDFVDLSINAEGQVQLDKVLVPTQAALLPRLQEIYARNKDQKFLISADKDARHGDVMAVLGKLRSAGFQKVAFGIKNEASAGAAGATSSLPESTVGASPAPGISVPTGSVPATSPVTAASSSAASPAPVTEATPAAPSTAAPSSSSATSVAAPPGN